MQKLSLTTDKNKHLIIKPVYESGFSEQLTLNWYKSSLIYTRGNNIVVEGQQNQYTLYGHDNTITTLTISPHRKMIVSGQMPSPGNKNYESPIMLWSLEKQKCIQLLNGLKDGVKKVLVSADQKLVVGCSLKNQLILWDLNNLQHIWTKTFENSINLLKLTSNAIIFTHGKQLQQVNLLPLLQSNKTPQITNYTLPSTGLPRNYLCLCQIGEDRYLLGTQGGEICLFQKGIFKWIQIVGKGKVYSILLTDSVNTILAGVEHQIIKLTIKDKGLNSIQKSVIANAQLIINNGQNSFIVQAIGALFELNGESLSAKLIKFSHSAGVIATHSRNNIIASIDRAATTLINKWEDGKAKMDLLSIYQHNKPTQGSAIYITQDNRIINGYLDGYLRCINIEGKLLWELSAHKNGVTTIWSNDQYMLTGGGDSVVRIWSLNKLINQISVHKKTVTKVFGDWKDSHIIHSCSIDRSIHTYDLKVDKKVNFRQLSNGSITDMIQTSPEGLLVTVGLGMPLCIWDMKSHQPIESYETNNLRVLCLDVVDGLCALGCEGGQILLFEWKKRNVVGWWMGHSKEVRSIRWLQGSLLMSSSDDNSIMIWKI